MSDNAGNGATASQDGSSTAGDQGQQIPKHRFDEVLSRVKELEEQGRIKDRFIESFQAQQQNHEPEFDPESIGLDKDTYSAIEQMMEKKIGGERQKLGRVIAKLANDNEELRFLQKHGNDKAKYLEKVRKLQADHYQETGSPMGVELAYKMVRHDELESRIRELETGKAQGTQGTAASAAAPTQAAPQSSAGPAGGGDPASGGSAAADKSFEDLEPEEMEARLKTQMESEGLTI